MSLIKVNFVHNLEYIFFLRIQRLSWLISNRCGHAPVFHRRKKKKRRGRATRTRRRRPTRAWRTRRPRRTTRRHRHTRTRPRTTTRTWCHLVARTTTTRTRSRPRSRWARRCWRVGWGRKSCRPGSEGSKDAGRATGCLLRGLNLESHILHPHMTPRTIPNEVEESYKERR